MTPELKKNLVEEAKRNTMTCVREYLDVFNNFITMMEKEESETFESMVELMEVEANDKASSPFQRFLIGYILTKKTAMDICMKFFERHKQWEMDEMQKEKNIDELRDYFMKRTKELFNKRENQ